MQYIYPVERDQQLVQIADAALADSARRSGKWLACKPGCSQCCVGVFAINQLDALRLQRGLAAMDMEDPERAARIRTRAKATVANLTADFPGDPVTGIISEDESEEAKQRWNDFANDVPCPALHTENGTCEIYSSRPMLCRTFGPPVKCDEDTDDLTVCDLCFDGATDDEVTACEMIPDPEHKEDALLEELEKGTGARGETIIAFALAR
ncbi:MAG TPA: YkgJ family cysteine cluster protein [Terriglobales bacterium]|jgi:Fe-S-cluster containining protein|nr:YkgJ family cysteine cluster protein [Terriglobales bacterium]